MANLINLSDHQDPVVFEVEFIHHFDGKLVFEVKGAAFEPRSMRSVADCLLRAACVIEQEAAKQENGDDSTPNSDPS